MRLVTRQVPKDMHAVALPCGSCTTSSFSIRICVSLFLLLFTWKSFVHIVIGLMTLALRIQITFKLRINNLIYIRRIWSFICLLSPFLLSAFVWMLVWLWKRRGIGSYLNSPTSFWNRPLKLHTAPSQRLHGKGMDLVARSQLLTMIQGTKNEDKNSLFPPVLKLQAQFFPSSPDLGFSWIERLTVVKHKVNVIYKLHRLIVCAIV